MLKIFHAFSFLAKLFDFIAIVSDANHLFDINAGVSVVSPIDIMKFSDINRDELALAMYVLKFGGCLATASPSPSPNICS